MAASPTHWQWVWGMCERRQMATYPQLLNTQPHCPQNLGQGQTAWEGSQGRLQFRIEACLFLFLGVLWPGTFGGAH